MRFTGYLDKYGHPFIRVFLTFPAIHKEGFIEFLVDTGSDSSSLNSADAASLRIPISPLNFAGYAQGVGQTEKYDVRATGALVFFADNGAQRTELLPQSVILKDVRYSLLGRDIIQRFKLYFDRTTVYLET